MAADDRLIIILAISPLDTKVTRTAPTKTEGIVEQEITEHSDAPGG